MSPNNYRQNVAAVITNNNNEILICQRVDNKAWQFPQGGVDNGETQINALFRELLEELGTINFKALSRTQKTYKYKWPNMLNSRDNYIGQEQTYYLVKFLGEDSDFHIDNREFKAFKWTQKDDVLKKVEKVRRPTYEKVFKEFENSFPTST